MKFTSMIPNTEGCTVEERLGKIEDCLQRMAQELDYALENLDESNFSEQGILALRGD